MKQVQGSRFRVKKYTMGIRCLALNKNKRLAAGFRFQASGKIRSNRLVVGGKKLKIYLFNMQNLGVIYSNERPIILNLEPYTKSLEPFNLSTQYTQSTNQLNQLNQRVNL
jgi:hypothetical protein